MYRNCPTNQSALVEGLLFILRRRRKKIAQVTLIVPVQIIKVFEILEDPIHEIEVNNINWNGCCLCFNMEYFYQINLGEQGNALVDQEVDLEIVDVPDLGNAEGRDPVALNQKISTLLMKQHVLEISHMKRIQRRKRYSQKRCGSLLKNLLYCTYAV